VIPRRGEPRGRNQAKGITVSPESLSRRLVSFSLLGGVLGGGVLAVCGCGLPPARTIERPDAEREVVFAATGGGSVPMGGRNTISVEVNGERVDRIIFDTGAGAFVLSPKLARRLDLPRTGTTEARSPGGVREAHTFWVDSLGVGDMTIRNLEGIELGLGFTGFLGLFTDINGLVGHPVMEAGVVEYDASGGTLGVYDRGAYRLAAGADWVPLRTTAWGYGLDVGYEGGEGIFLIDTGAELVVQINGDTVAEAGLDEGKKGRRGRVGIMGAVLPTLRTDLAWIEVGGERFGGLDADLVLDPDHTMDEIAGMLGQGFFQRCLLVIDLEGERAALIPPG